MELWELLAIRCGVTAVIGSGGKTGLMEQLASELRQRGTVLLCTTTKMWLPSPEMISTSAREAKKALGERGFTYLGRKDESLGKLLPPDFSGWETMADFMLVEADGAAGRPLKAHAPWEPVLPEGRKQTICVVGASGIGKPISLAAHRPEIFSRLCGAET